MSIYLQIKKYLYKPKQINLNSDKPTLENNLKETIQLLTKKKNRVYLVSPLPEPGINERMYYLKNKKYLNEK